MNMSIIGENTNIETDNLRVNIERIAKKEGFLTYTINMETVDTTGLNYLGKIFKVTINGEDVLEAKEVNIFVKSKPTDGSSLRLLSINDVYSRELYAYKELSDVYKQLQEDANVPFEDRYNFVKFYDESNTDVIMLEDLSKLGYESCDRHEFISIDFAKKCLKQLAKFHALSFVLEKEKLDYFNCNIKLLKYPFIYNDDYVKFLNKMNEICLNHLDGEHKVKLESVGDICEKYYHFVNNNSVIRCLCHGDYRTMNIMKKRINGELSEVMPLDYQFLFYGSPVLDILYFIFGSTDRKFRRKHLQNLKDIYHDTMKDFLNYFKMDINLCYSRNEFDKAYNESLEFGLIVAVWYLPINLMGGNDKLELTLANAKFNINSTVKERLEDIIDDLTEWGVFKTNV